MGGGQKCRKIDPPFFGVKNHESFGFFFDFEPKKYFPGPDSMWFVWSVVGRALMRFMHFSTIFAMSALLVTSVTLWYPLRGM